MAEPSIAAQVLALQQLTVAELRLKWQALTGQETTQRNKAYLVRRCGWELQRQHFGGELSPEAKARLSELQEEFRNSPPSSWFKGARHNRRASAPTPPAPADPPRDDRRPRPGTILTRDFKGERITVTIRAEREIEWRGQMFRSLSAVAKAITGSHCSGHAFFGLTRKQEVQS
jgi:hypothetical protein